MGKEELKLTFNTTLQRWEGETGIVFIWMDDHTFRRYVDAYIEGNKTRIARNNLKEMPITREAAIEHCKRLSYWNGCRYDRNVHMTRLGKAVPRD